MDRYKEILEGMHEGVYFVDLERKITFWNKGAERITGFKAEEVLNSHCYENILNHVDNYGNRLCHGGGPLHKTLSDGINREAAVFLLHKQGHRVPVSVRIIPIYDDNDLLVGSAEVFVDDTELIQLTTEMKNLKEIAYRDQLTGVPNRRYIDTVLTNKMIQFETLGVSFGLAMIDVDHFKKVNDTFGHEVGDEVLKLLSRTVVGNLRQDDYFGRWGGEEFMIVFNRHELADVTHALERIRIMVGESVCRLDNGEEIQITISGGASVFRGDDTIKSLIERIDELMYRAKETGRNRVIVE